MSDINTTIAILTQNKAARYRDKVSHCIVHENFNDGVQKLPGALATNGTNLHLIIDGGHGNAHAQTGRPLLLNDQSVESIKQQVQALKKRGLLFKTITLTSCFSASFVPLFKDVLMDDGIIFCQTLSSTDVADRLLEEARGYNNDILSTAFAVLACKISETLALCKNMLNHTQCFVSDAIYTKQDDTLHRFKFNDINEALKAHNKIIIAGNDRDCKHELDAIENYLAAQGICVSDEHTNAEQLEIQIRELCLRFKMHPIQPNDFNHIKTLDDKIFPSTARQIDLNHYYDKNYSWLIVDNSQDNEPIIGYIFAKPEGKNSLFIGNLGVNPSIRSCGIGTRLLKKVLHQAQQEKRTVRLEVHEDNESAIRLYKKLGFVEIGKNSDHLVMSHSPKPFQKSIIQPQIQPLNNNSEYYSFLINLAAFSLGICLLCAAATFFPPLGLASTFGIQSIANLSMGTSYALSGVSALASLASFGFFAQNIEKNNTNYGSESVVSPAYQISIP